MGNSESCCIFKKNSYKVSCEKGIVASKEVINMDFDSRLSSNFDNNKVSQNANSRLQVVFTELVCTNFLSTIDKHCNEKPNVLFLLLYLMYFTFCCVAEFELNTKKLLNISIEDFDMFHVLHLRFCAKIGGG